MAVDGRRHVVAFGGLPGPAEQSARRAGVDYLARLTGRRQPRICLLTTATGDDPAAVERAREYFGAAGMAATHLALFPMPSVADPEDFLLSQDLIMVGGGSVANMLAVWRVHGLDRIMRAAWHAGVVLTGVSAGAICWFDGGTTDSFGPRLRPFTDGLGLLAGSYCPHYDGEPQRRPVFTSLVADATLAPGIACDDGAGAHFIDDDLHTVVTLRQGARGYRVARDGAGRFTETPLAVRALVAGTTRGPGTTRG